MPNGATSLTLLLCAGKDCFKKERSAFEDLKDAATCSGLSVKTVGCQGSCAGPTAVVPTDSGHRWFEKLQTPKAQRDLVEFATGAVSRPSDRLAKRELTGKQRTKAAKKLASR